MTDSPDVRIGTAEREEAISRLSEHFSAGRLSMAEFETRSDAVVAARTRSDLAVLFTDLPAEQRSQPVTAVAESRRDWSAMALALCPIAAVVLFFVTGSWLWFLMIPAAGIVLGGERTRHHRTTGRRAIGDGRIRERRARRRDGR